MPRMRARRQISYAIQIDDPKFPGDVVLIADLGGAQEFVAPLTPDDAEKMAHGLAEAATRARQQTAIRHKVAGKSGSFMMDRERGERCDS
jgi:hypothetical protein